MAGRLLRSMLAIGTSGLACSLIYSSAQNDPTHWLWKKPLPTFAQLFDPEQAHRLFIIAAANGLLPHYATKPTRSVDLSTSVWGIHFDTPVGIAAGLDKHAEAVDPLMRMGYGFVEIGSVTPRPQEGNPKPRVFRLPEDKAVINRYGFNSEGIPAVVERLKNWKASTKKAGVLGVNVGKNKDTITDPASDFVFGILSLGKYADYIVVNISSPNTPGLRSLQRKEELSGLIVRCQAAQKEVGDKAGRHIPLLVKIAPDLTEDERRDIAEVALSQKIDGLIVSNTTMSRPDTLKGSATVVKEAGGLSGQPLKPLALQLTKDMYKLTNGTVPIIGVGGISNGEDAYERIKAGASLVQVYTALSYEGPGLGANISNELAELMKRDGITSVRDVVGKDVRA